MKTHRYQCRKCSHNFTVRPHQLTTADIKMHCEHPMLVTEAIQWVGPAHTRTDAETAWAVQWCVRQSIIVDFGHVHVRLRQGRKHLCTGYDLADAVKGCIEHYHMEE